MLVVRLVASGYYTFVCFGLPAHGGRLRGSGAEGTVLRMMWAGWICQLGDMARVVSSAGV